MTALFIGLMSGTSLDGVDGVVVEFGPAHGLSVRAHVHRPFPAALRSDLLALNAEGPNELHRAALAGNALAREYAATVSSLLASSGLPASDIVAIGAHGQTVRHRPGAFDGVGYTLQLNNPALVAELCGIDVVADLRSRDVAAGGQGAPLVPAFHKAVFASDDGPVGILNLGGIANLTVVDPIAPTVGFDCGPANALMDEWCERHTGRTFDADGAWAACGTVLPSLLSAMLADAFFGQGLPKSTGRDRFNESWLQAHLTTLHGAQSAPAPADVQATLAELTARTCADAVMQRAPNIRELLVCGGGALNGHLMRRIAALLPAVQVADSSRRGLPAMQVEATAFAWLAQKFAERRPGNLPEVTGAMGLRVLGALWPK
ncbi:MAG: anhydro-N-acetylmuramic acid kinase [Rhizobacter sp.]|nr:anhydro-N-acetylmuramic acid kinase [Rhizobacter sp.]